MRLRSQFKMKILLLPILLIISTVQNGAVAMFKDVTDKLIPMGTPVQRNYGVAVTNIGEGEGPMEWIIAGYSGPNIVLQMDTRTGVYKNVARIGTQYESLMDPEGNAIGVCACDIDGDGKEEIYFLNTNNRYSGRKLVTDRLFTWRNNRYENLFEDEINKNVLSMFSGRSVACIDRTGNGKYGILLATYAEMGSGKFELIEVDEMKTRGKNIVLHSIAENVGINFTTGGRGIVVGPVLGDDGFSDIYFVNEGNWRLQNRGDNAFFKNDGSGRFTNIAAQLDLDDLQPGRGVTLTDFNNDELIDIAYGNWNGPHKMFLQRKNHAGESTFYNVASPEFSTPSYIRTVIAADFDNDGITEVLFNNIVYRGDASNKLFKIIPNGRGVSMTSVDIGDAQEQDKYGTGAAVADIDDDGVLELLISHGESASQPVTLYHVKRSGYANNNFIRIMPTTQSGAPARGSKITLTLNDGTKLSRIIDGGSGYLCQMEPVAHFGLGPLFPQEARILWPDGHHHFISLNSRVMNRTLIISFNGDVRSHQPQRSRTVYHFRESTDEEIKDTEDSSSKESQQNRRRRPHFQGGRRHHRMNRNRKNQYQLRSSGGHTSNIRKPTSVETVRPRFDTSIRTGRRHSTSYNSPGFSSQYATAHAPSHGRSQNRNAINHPKSHPSPRSNAQSRQQRRKSAESHNQRTRYISSRREGARSQRRYSSKTGPYIERLKNSALENTHSHREHTAKINRRNPLSGHSTIEDTHSQPRQRSRMGLDNPQTEWSRPEDSGSHLRHSTNADRHHKTVSRHSGAMDSRSQLRHSTYVNRYNPRTRHSSADDTLSHQRNSNSRAHYNPLTKLSYNSITRHSTGQDTRSHSRHPSRVELSSSESRLSTRNSNTRRKQMSNTKFPGTNFSPRESSHGPSPSRTNRFNPNSRYSSQANIGSHQRHSSKMGNIKPRNPRPRYPSFQHQYPIKSESYNPHPRSSRGEILDPVTRTTFAYPHSYHTTQPTPPFQRSQSRQIQTRSHLRLPRKKGSVNKDLIQPRKYYPHTRHLSLNNKQPRQRPPHNITQEDHSSIVKHGRKLEPYSRNRSTKWVAYVPNSRKHSVVGLRPKAAQHPSLHESHSLEENAEGSHSRETRTQLEPLRGIRGRPTSTSSRRRRPRNKIRVSSYKMSEKSRYNSNFGHSAFHFRHSYPSRNSQQSHHRSSSEFRHSGMSSSTNLNTNARLGLKPRISTPNRGNSSQFPRGRSWTQGRGENKQNNHHRLSYKET